MSILDSLLKKVLSLWLRFLRNAVPIPNPKLTNPSSLNQTFAQGEASGSRMSLKDQCAQITGMALGVGRWGQEL